MNEQQTSGGTQQQAGAQQSGAQQSGAQQSGDGNMGPKARVVTFEIQGLKGHPMIVSEFGGEKLKNGDKITILEAAAQRFEAQYGQYAKRGESATQSLPRAGFSVQRGAESQKAQDAAKAKAGGNGEDKNKAASTTQAGAATGTPGADQNQASMQEQTDDKSMAGKAKARNK